MQLCESRAQSTLGSVNRWGKTAATGYVHVSRGAGVAVFLKRVWRKLMDGLFSFASLGKQKVEVRGADQNRISLAGG